MTSIVKLHSLVFRDYRTYLFAMLFVAGNIILPQLCHLVPQGGLVLLPIYFFTLIASYKYGIRVGLLTAILSPVVNHLIFGMPPAAVLPVILFKSTCLAFAGAYAARFAGKVSLAAVLAAVLAYQIAGGMFEWAWTGSLSMAVQDFRIGIPGILLQVFGGYAVLRAIARL